MQVNSHKNSQYLLTTLVNNIPLLKNRKMAEEKDNQNDGFYYLLGTIFGALTGFAITETVIFALLGAIIGALFAAFFVNALVKDRTY